MQNILLFIMLITFGVSCEEYQESPKLINNQILREPLNHKNRDQENLVKIHSIFNNYKKEFPLVKNIQPKDLNDIKSKDIIFIDVREENEQNVSMIQNAMKKSDFEDKKNEFKDKILIIYCTIGYRSGHYADQLLKEGFNAYNLLGGVLLWSHSSLNFYHNSQVTQNVHTYSKDWNYLHSSYKAFY